MPNCRILGLTATPGRSGNYEDPSNRTLAQYFGNNLIKIKDDKGFVVSSPISYLQEHQYLARIERKSLQVDITDFSIEEIDRIRKSGELDQDEIERIVRSPIRNKLIVDEIGKALKDESKNLILVFACSVNHCNLLKILLHKEGIQSEVILSSTPKQQRDAHISGFKDGKIKVLINYGVLTTGFDAPKLKTLVIARHTNSIILYSQMIGRALRGPLNGGNEANYIIDLIDNFKTLGKPEFQFSYWEEIWDN
jgi:superfamily II DNA or RNA helicase